MKLAVSRLWESLLIILLRFCSHLCYILLQKNWKRKIIEKKRNITGTQKQKPATKTTSCKFFYSQVLSACLNLVVWLECEFGESWNGGHFQGEVFVGEATWNIVFCLERGKGVSFFFHILCFCRLLTVARSRVLDLQQHPHRTSSLFHGTFTGICGVVAGTHRLVCPALWTGFITQRAAAPAHPSIPQTFFPCAALDVLTWLGL